MDNLEWEPEGIHFSLSSFIFAFPEKPTTCGNDVIAWEETRRVMTMMSMFHFQFSSQQAVAVVSFAHSVVT